MKFVEQANIYLIIYPNGKIYIGQDRTDDINYFGSANGTLIEKDFNSHQRRDFTVRKKLLGEYRNISIIELNKLEKNFILKFDSNNPDKGYNRSPGFKRLPRKTQHVYEK